MMLFIFHCLLLVTFKNFRNTHVIPFEVQNGAHTTYPVKFLVFSVGNIGKYNFSVHSVIRKLDASVCKSMDSDNSEEDDQRVHTPRTDSTTPSGSLPSKSPPPLLPFSVYIPQNQGIAQSLEPRLLKTPQSPETPLTSL